MSASPDPSEVLADGRHLRDMFAVEALKGLIGSASQVEAAHDMSTTTPMTPTEILVGAAYEYSDMMLRIRRYDPNGAT